MTLALLHNAILQVFTNLFYRSHNPSFHLVTAAVFHGIVLKMKNLIEHPEIFWLFDEAVRSGERINQDLSESRAYVGRYRSVTES